MPVQRLRRCKCLFIALCFFSSEAQSQQNSLDGCDVEFKKAVDILDAYQFFWKRDSLGRNGVRFIIAETFLGHPECFKDKSWSEVEKYLGTL